MAEITRQEFLEYEQLRQSGIANMVGASSVLGWSHQKVGQAQGEYDALMAKWPEVRDEAADGAERWRDMAECRVRNMTPQDYDAIARMIAAATSEHPLISKHGAVHKVAYVNILAEECAMYFEQDNPGFDRSRFLERALGTTEG